MNPQVLQALMQTLQQAMQILQQAGGDPNMQLAGGDPNMQAAAGAAQQQMAGRRPPRMAGRRPFGKGEDDEPEDDDMPDSDMDDDIDDEDEDEDMGGSIHDRVAALESHTGLKKTASRAAIRDRVADLEQYWLGEEWEGPLVARVRQLEKAARVSTARRPALEDAAPDEIPLDALIKTAIQEGIKQGLEQILHKEQLGELPSVSSMRKAAKQFGERRSQAPIVPNDEALLKAAGVFGYDEEDLDKPISFADVLLMQYHAAQNGVSVLEDDDD